MIALDTTMVWSNIHRLCPQCKLWFDATRVVGDMCLDCLIAELKQEESDAATIAACEVNWEREESRPQLKPGCPARAKQRPTPKARAPPNAPAISGN